MRALVERCAEWAEQCSKHLHHLENRAMAQEYLGHELIRQLQAWFRSYTPPPRGDWGWVMRGGHDLATKQRRQLVRYYGGMRAQSESGDDFSVRMNKVVTLYFEEAWHRCMLGAEGEDEREVGSLRAALCDFVRTLQGIELQTMGERYCEECGIYQTFTENNVRELARKVAGGVRTSVEDMPTWGEVVRMRDIRHEVVSLMTVKFTDDEVKFSKRTLRTLVEKNEERRLNRREVSKLEGTEGPSPYEAIFGV